MKLLSPASLEQRFLIQLNLALKRPTNTSKHLCAGWVSEPALIYSLQQNSPKILAADRAKHLCPKSPPESYCMNSHPSKLYPLLKEKKETAVYGECPRVFKYYERWKRSRCSEILDFKTKLYF